MNTVSGAAKLLGRRGGLKGGVARANALSARRRMQIARRAIQARWEERLPAELHDLFWEFDARELRVAKAKATIFLKVLTRGRAAHKAWLAERFGREQVRAWIVGRHGRGITSATMREWGVTAAELRRMRQANPALDMWNRR
jgi:uncharacterized protein DUF6922